MIYTEEIFNEFKTRVMKGPGEKTDTLEERTICL